MTLGVALPLGDSVCVSDGVTVLLCVPVSLGVSVSVTLGLPLPLLDCVCVSDGVDVLESVIDSLGVAVVDAVAVRLLL